MVGYTGWLVKPTGRLIILVVLNRQIILFDFVGWLYRLALSAVRLYRQILVLLVVVFVCRLHWLGTLDGYVDCSNTLVVIVVG